MNELINSDGRTVGDTDRGTGPSDQDTDGRARDRDGHTDSSMDYGSMDN